MELHEGHRQRLKQRYLRFGAPGMSEHELLELILTYAIPRRNVNPLAHELINKYGSLEAVFRESPSALASNSGVSQHTAVLLRLFGEAAGSTLCAPDPMRRRNIYTVRDAMEFCMSVLGRGGAERCCVIMLDANGAIADIYVEEGEVYALRPDIKRMVARTLACGACSVVVGHSHPVGSASPSKADIELARMLREVFSHLDVDLSEQIIVSDDDCYAMLHDVHLCEVEASRGEDPAALRPVG